MQPAAFALSIDGRLVRTPETADVINPATEEVICAVPLASKAHLDEAVHAAQVAFKSWRERPLADRQRLVSALGDALEQHHERFVELLITEQGKARAGAEWEIGGAIHWCREIARQSLEDEVVEQDGDEQIISRHTPIGVIGAITPWNFPVLLAIWKVAPALVAGNTMVLKPSPFTPLCTLLLGELANQILPPGVLNVLSGGNELGQWITEHPGIGKISFTGSTETGKRVMQSASVNLKRLTLELGGNDPAIVLADVDAKAIAKDLFWAAFSNSAQFCVACKRLYVHEAVYDDVARELVAYAHTVRMGNGMQPGVDLGPLQNRMQYEKVKDLLQDCQINQQRFLIGGEASAAKGYFIPVTIIDNPPDDARCVTEEAFGPVLPLLRFSDVEEVIARANGTDFGLAASVWSNDLEEAQRIARRLEAGTVWINHAHQFSPHIAFGGHKTSGLGIENSLHGLAEYTNIQTVLQKAGH
ncbi:aldehyde dehydrogenase [Pseudomonas alkylphenolica]|uniref:Aldehyde dehydrogenase n=1 Tax=Pseudomonas alkylphenolica TaxID=237609 RepID=A0A443ZEU3_9PSED|nr:aldehyde dehydrogenase family protein [Pseudomonas alkylphenolica]RWU17218.1 aldehyde dehydrogenase [Pseudomonas alkylphenolica]